MALDIGRVAYMAYKAEMDRDSYREAVLWEKLDKEVQDAWRKAGVAVMEYLDEERERIEHGIIG